ncbi:hypothetical protein N24_2324 [Corynebacterium suranareeae]|uniref:Uncharacterized protein n=2 Tax=Corynebacterium suranareeae TaxID=2506452 RepID=A0A160PS95_9CORY|nr:hypothetical protein N24_2324 [Corynebacterium suranareeae]
MAGELFHAPLLGENRPYVYRVTGPPPPGTVKVDHGELRAPVDTRVGEQWNTRAQVHTYSLRFNQEPVVTPQSARIVQLDGATWASTTPTTVAGDPVQLHTSTHSFFASQAHFEPDFDILQFSQIAGLYTLTMRGIPASVETVESLVRALPNLVVLSLPDFSRRATLDLRQSQLKDLTVDLASVGEVHLPHTIEQLTIHAEDPTQELRIATPRDGAELDIVAKKKLPRITGVDNLRLLQISEIEHLDIAQIAEDFPGLRALQLWGKPGIIQNAQDLLKLKELHTLRLQDLFGWSAQQWPGKRTQEQMPALDALLMNSVPADVAQAGKELMKRRVPAWVDIRGPRKPGWLAENIDNPLRHWGENPHIPTSAAKKAGNIYKETLRTIRTSTKAPDHAPLQETLRSFIASINQLAAKKNFIDAGEREDIVVALEKLCEAAGASSEEIQQAIVVGEELIED